MPEKLPEVDESEYKRIEDYRIVNNPDIQRRDTPGKVFGGVMNGEKMFSVDVQLPGMLYATSRRNHFGNREVVRIVNEDEVLALPDVIGVEVILDSVTVIAQTYESARKGEKLLQVEWSNAEEDARYNSDEELERLKAIAYDESREGIDVMGHWRARLRGQAGQAEGLDEALASADEVHQRLYTTGFMYHAQMETLNAVVDVTDNGQKAEVWAGTQGPTQTRMRVAEVLGIPTENVTLHRNFMGGGFGRKAVRSHDNFVEAAMLSKKYEAPVKVIWSRENDLIAGHYRPHGAHLVTATPQRQGRDRQLPSPHGLGRAAALGRPGALRKRRLETLPGRELLERRHIPRGGEVPRRRRHGVHGHTGLRHARYRRRRDCLCQRVLCR